MSSKRIQKRLDQLFIDIKHAEEPSLKPLNAEPSGPESPRRKTGRCPGANNYSH